METVINNPATTIEQIASLKSQLQFINKEIARRVSLKTKEEKALSKSFTFLRDISPRGMKIALTRMSHKLGLELFGVEVKTGVKTLHFTSDCGAENRFKIKQMVEDHGYVLV